MATEAEARARDAVVAAAREINDWFITHGLKTGLSRDHPAHQRLERAEVALIDALAALDAARGAGE